MLLEILEIPGELNRTLLLKGSVYKTYSPTLDSSVPVNSGGGRLSSFIPNFPIQSL
jgi:hypothetical protein